MKKNDIYFNENMYSKFKKKGYTNFLDKIELQGFISYLNRKKESYFIYFVYEQADKVIVYKEKIPSISCFQIETKSLLTHSSILGSLFSLQISPSLFGDIILWDNHFYFFCLEEISSYFLSSLKQIGKNKVTLKSCDISIFSEYKRNYEEKIISCSSIRLDTVLAHLLNLSRKSVEELFHEKKVLLNYEIASKTKKLKENDIFSVRKYGKYRYIGIIKENKKGKYYLKIEKYL